MAPTIQDVSYLLGLPLVSEAIGQLEVADDWLLQILGCFLAVVSAPGNLEHDAHGPHFSWLGKFQDTRAFNCRSHRLIDA